jgi:PAS domain S-box-containing protein
MASAHAFQCDHKLLLVLMSYAVSAIGAYGSLLWATQIPYARGRELAGWLAGAAVAMGGAIWSMHFIAMIACRLPVPVAYGTLLTFASFLVAVVTTALGLAIVGRGGGRRGSFLAGGALTGLGVAAMHYTSMAAMRLPAEIRWRPALVAASILIAVAAATAALWLAFHLRFGWRRAFGAQIMGGAICGMHYTGMAAAVFTPHAPRIHLTGSSLLSTDELGFGVFAVTLGLLAVISLGCHILVRQREEEDRARFFSISLDLLCLVGFDGTFRRLNSAWERSLGYSIAELVGSSALELVHPDDREATRAELERLAHGAASAAFENRFLCKDGSVRWLLWHAAPDLERQAVVANVRDVTERLQAEEELRRAREELAHASRATAMGELVASIAHEVNQPLAALVANGNASLHWLALQPPNLREAREATERIVRDGHRASDVVSRIRGLFRKAEGPKTPLDLNEVLRDALRLVEGELRRRRVKVVTDLATPLPRGLGDRVQLQQVILNLVLNASEAMQAVAGSPRHPRRISIRTAARGAEGIEVSVRDEGVGIAPEELGRVFDPFFTTKPEGLGLGLAVSRSILESHGGRIWVTSEPGRGSTFHFTLPLARTESEARAS